MTRHPGGLQNTGKMLDYIPRKGGERAIDLGAGAGDSVRFMRELGIRAVGVDIAPKVDPGTDFGIISESGIIELAGDEHITDSSVDMVTKCDFLNLPYADESFDIALSQCAFFVSGDVKRAVREASRVLKKGGHLALADLDDGSLKDITENAGIRITYYEDMTPAWREYYIEAIWGDGFCCDEYRELAALHSKDKLRYSMYIGKKI